MNQEPLSPFYRLQPNGQVLGTVDGAGRLQEVKRFDLDQCRRALEHTDGLQATVRKSLEARIRKLEREVRRASA